MSESELELGIYGNPTIYCGTWIKMNTIKIEKEVYGCLKKTCLNFTKRLHGNYCPRCGTKCVIFNTVGEYNLFDWMIENDNELFFSVKLTESEFAWMEYKEIDTFEMKNLHLINAQVRIEAFQQRNKKQLKDIQDKFGDIEYGFGVGYCYD